MIELLAGFSITQIILCIIGIIHAIKGGWDLFDYFKNKYDEKFNKDYSKKRKEELLEEHYVNCKKQHDETVEQYNVLSGKLDNIENSIQDLTHRVDELTVSDMHDIKQSIVKDYHYFVEHQGWIDDFSLDTLELRFNDYKMEGGNSYIAGLMSEIRQLPKHPPVMNN